MRGRASKRVLAAVFAAAALTPAAHAARPTRAPAATTPVDPAIAMYVEQVPTSSGPKPADPSLRARAGRSEGSSGGAVLLVVALALVTVSFGGTLLRRARASR